MNIAKIKKITSEALQSRGYSVSEAEQIIAQIAANSEGNATETLPGSGIFCPEDRQKRCVSRLMAQRDEYKHLWQTWMNRCHDLKKYVEDAVKPFNKKIKEINLYRDRL